MRTVADTVRALAERHGGETQEDDGSLLMRCVPAEGVWSFARVDDDPAALFAPTARAEVSTLVATEVEPTDAVVDFLDWANSTAFGGAWEWYTNGDLGVTGSFLVQPHNAEFLTALCPQLLALQVRDALEVGRPQGTSGFPDATGASTPTARSEWPRSIALQELAERVQWRSSYHESQRWELDTVNQADVTFFVPRFVGDLVRDNHDELAPGLQRLVLARTEHPRRGQGTLIQVHLPSAVQDAAMRNRLSSFATSAGRWYGTCLGAVMVVTTDEEPEVVYRAFVPDDLLSVLYPEVALSVLSDAVLGSVNAAGVASAVYDAQSSERDLEEAQRNLRMNKRSSVLRAATQTRPQADGYVDLAGPAVDVGGAMLDRLALDQLQIATAPYVVHERGFGWLPTRHAQWVRCEGLRPSRGLEIDHVRIETHLGTFCESDFNQVVDRCEELQRAAPLASLIASDGVVRLVSTVMIHEGVWWHRSAMLPVVAALHTNLAPSLAEQLEDSGVIPGPDPAFPTEFEGPDPIVDVVPELLTMIRDDRETVLPALRRQLSDNPGAGAAPDAGPDAVVTLRANDHDGDWNPSLGVAAIFLDMLDDEHAGPAVRVGVHPGFPVNHDGPLAEVAMQLTEESHHRQGNAFSSSWQVLGETVGPMITVPEVAIAHGDASDKVHFLDQAASACLFNLGEVVLRRPDLFPHFDRSQANSARTPELLPPAVPSVPDLTAWAPAANRRVLAVRRSIGAPDRWSSVSLTSEAAQELERWLDSLGVAHFQHQGTDLVARPADGTALLEFPDGYERRLEREGRMALQAALRYPEAAAAGRSDAVLVTQPIHVSGDEAIYWMLPPAPKLVECFARDVSFDGITATTSESLWARFRSPRGQVHVNLQAEPARTALELSSGERRIPMVFAFPTVDPRVAKIPPPTEQRVSLSTAELQAVLG